MREYLADESVDLIYLDPPFNSQRNYNVLFKDESGSEAEAQIVAFEDTWHWNLTTEATYNELVTQGAVTVSGIIAALRQALGANQMTAYLVMMAARLVELHRILKPTGSLYLHCDGTASHYLKIILDSIFGVENFRNEIIWRRTNVHSDSKTWSIISDTIFFYSKSAKFLWKPIYVPHSEEHIKAKYAAHDANGKAYTLSDMTSPNPRPNMMYEWKGHSSPPNGWRYSQETMARLDAEGRIWYPNDKSKRPRLKRFLDEMPGTLVSNIWTDINPINSQAQERVGYPTQKPVALLERILQASSNKGDIVLDPFAGCGSTVVAAQKLGRQWIGIDITHLSVAILKYRLQDSFKLTEKQDYQVIGEPEDVADARQLAAADRYQFQWWALSLIKARPVGGTGGGKQGKKGSDKGIDGVITFLEDTRGAAQRLLVQVKSGKVKSGDIRDLRGVIEREKAAMGVFITLEEPSRDMLAEASAAGFYRSTGWGQDYPKLQILTVAALLNEAEVRMPPTATTFKVAPAVPLATPTTPKLF